MKLGTNDIGSVYLGSNAVQKVYLGTNEVWSSFSGGLLDTYSGAAAAYSLRRLSSSYTGKAIRVRRSVGSPSEINIGFSGEDLDIATLESFCSGTNGFVTTWYDQSGNGRDATQTTAENQPQIVSSGSVITENGKPSVQFDGSNDFLSYAFTTNISQPGAYFVVNQNTKDAGIISSDNNNSRWQIFRTSAGDDPINVFSGAVLSSSNNTTNQILIFALFNGLNSAIGINNNSATIGDAGTQENSAIRLGLDSGTTYGQNKMQEVILYNSDQSSNRTGIEDNINDFYSIY
jgi:hypothetical protein